MPEKKLSMFVFGLPQTIILMFTGIVGAALFFFGHGPLELIGVIFGVTVVLLGLISLWFYLSEKENEKPAMLALKGKIYEIGSLKGSNGRGMRLEADGEEIAITGMTEEECRTAAQWFGKEVSITISV